MPTHDQMQSGHGIEADPKLVEMQWKIEHLRAWAEELELKNKALEQELAQLKESIPEIKAQAVEETMSCAQSFDVSDIGEVILVDDIKCHIRAIKGEKL